jgi:hypothetical protein
LVLLVIRQKLNGLDGELSTHAPVICPMWDLSGVDFNP